MEINEALGEVRMLLAFNRNKYPPSPQRDKMRLALDTVLAEVARLREVTAPPKCAKCRGSGQILGPSDSGYMDCPACNGRG